MIDELVIKFQDLSSSSLASSTFLEKQTSQRMLLQV